MQALLIHPYLDVTKRSISTSDAFIGAHFYGRVLCDVYSDCFPFGAG